MSTPIVWKNVNVAMQSAIAATKTVSAVTKANPGVVSSTAHGYNNGDYVYIDVLGMYQIDEKVVRVANKTTDSFELEGVDTTNFDTFTSGTVQALTFGTAITTALTVNGSGGDFAFVYTTTIHANTKTQIPGLPSAISYQFSHIWDAADGGLLAMKAASDIQGKRAFRFTFGTGGKVLCFAGYVGCSMLPGGQAQGLVTTSAVITMNGTPTYYSA